MSSRKETPHSKKEPVPDVPQMRSVLIRSPSSFEVPAPRALSVSPKAPPVTVSTLRSSKNGPWKLEKSQLLPLPEVYLLERSHVCIESIEVQDVATNIAECLRKESIAAVFDSHKAMALAETPQHVKLCIRLFLDDDQVVVEVQRRAGCCFLFHQSAKAILRAAKGMKRESLPTFKVPDCVLKDAQPDVSEQDPTVEAIEIASGLLKKDRLDAHLLGMESLVQLTKASSTCTKAALAVVECNVLDIILSLIQSWHISQEQEVEPIDEMEKDYFAMMHRYALTVLANCLAALEQAGKLTQVTSSQGQLVADELLAVLIDELDSAEKRPHDACQACKCLKMLMRSSKPTKMRALKLGAPNAATSAFNEGVCTLLSLEEEARTLQVEIGR